MICWPAGLRGEALLRLRLAGDRVIERERVLEGELGRIRTVRQGNHGHIYLLVDAAEGGLWRLSPTTARAAATCAE